MRVNHGGVVAPQRSTTVLEHEPGWLNHSRLLNAQNRRLAGCVIRHSDFIAAAIEVFGSGAAGTGYAPLTGVPGLLPVLLADYRCRTAEDVGAEQVWSPALPMSFVIADVVRGC
jgi:hypothetical protein